MRFKKWILSLLAAMMTLFVGIGVAACDEDETEQPMVEGPETGVFYYDDVLTNREYRIVLSKGNQVIFLVSDKNETGIYTAESGNLSFTFAGFTAGAVYTDDALTLTYENSQMTFLRAIEYTVDFEEAGGSEVAAQTVLNGRTATQPDTPVREGYTFYGWYEDENYTVPYSFTASAVRGNKTLYAYWGKNGTNGVEFDVDFDLGYTAEGVTAPETTKTNGGRVYVLTSPEREGYTFAGWWVSEENKADKLTYRFEQGETVLKESTTLFALWTQTTGDKLAAPLLSVTENGLTWDAVTGATGYEVYVDGEKVGEVNECEYSAARAFANLDDNKTQHEFKVIAKGATAEKNSDAAVRYYTPDALARVSSFNVVNSMLTFVGVENAEEYYISVKCGDGDHNHENVFLGKNTFYALNNCAMKEGGIEIVVTAKANGYVSSVSRTYYYNRALAAVENLAYDEATQTVTWKAVPDASSYVVTVKCGNDAHVIEKKNVGNATSFDLQYCSPAQDGVKVSVYPVTKGYNSPVATELSIEKTKLATPDKLTLNGNVLTWTEVPGKTSYEVVIDGVSKTADTNEYALSNVIGNVTVKVRALATDTANNSEWSEEKIYEYNGAPTNLTYANGVLTWDTVLGATKYTVSVNGSTTTCSGNSFIVANKVRAGENTLTVATEGGSVSLTVYFYKVTFDVNGGTPIADGDFYKNGATYVAYGDYLTLPEKGVTSVVEEGETIKELDGWYDAKGGAAANAKRFENGIFDETKDVTMYANWTGAKRTLTLDKNNDGATLSKTNVEVTFGKTTKFPVPELDGVVFGGWYTAAGGEGTAITDENGEMLQEWSSLVTTLYASWLQVLDFKLEENGLSYAVVAGKDISRVTQVTIPETYNGLPVDTIRAGAFQNCSKLQVINIPDTMRIVGSTTDVVSSGPFSGCKALTAVNVYETGSVVATESNYYSVDGTLINRLDGKIRLAYVPLAKTGAYVIPDGVEEIPTRLFASSYIREVTIPSSVTRIGENAFYSSTNLVSVKFADPDAVADDVNVFGLTIANNAFKSCRSLREISLPKRLEEMADEKGVSYVDGVFNGCSALVSVKVAQGNAYYTDMDGILCDANDTVIYCPLGREGTVTLSDIKNVADGAFKSRSKITKVVVPYYVEQIGASAFESCSALKEVVFEGSAISGTTTLGERAFYGCKVLNTVTFEEECNVKTIGKSAFANNTALRKVKLSNATEEVCESAFADCTALTSVEILGGGDAETKFGDYVFNGCSSLTTITLSEKVSDISLSMFNGCENLRDILVNDNNTAYKSVGGVLYSKDGAQIVYCPGKNLTLKDGATGEFVLPDTVTVIGDYAFAGHSAIEKIEIGAQITKIGSNAFAYCSELEELVFAERTTDLTIGDYAFAYCGSLSNDAKMTLPDTVTAIGDYAFYAAGVKEIGLGTGLKTIGDYAFAKTDLTAIVIPATVESFGDYLFSGCIKLTTVEINVSTNALIGTFEGCTALETATVQNGVTEIGEKAFYGAGKNAESGLTFAIPDTVEIIGAGAFEESGIASVTIPAKTSLISQGAFRKTDKLTTVTFAATAEGEEKVALTIDGKAATQEAYEYGAFSSSAITAIVLPERLTKIGNFAFYNDTALVSVTSEKATGDLEEICYGAFYGNANLATLVLPEGLKTIGQKAFYENKKMESLTIPATVETVGNTAFARGVFTTVTFAAGGEGELTIGEDAFASNTKLKQVTLPLTLKSLHRDAFSDDTAIESYALQEETGKTNQHGFSVTDGVLYLYKNETLERIFMPTNYAGFYEADGKTAKVYKIADEITELPSYTFYGSKIQKIDLNNVTKIGENAFMNSSLTEVTIGLKVTSIGSGAFKNAEKLAALTFEKAATKEEEANYKPLTIGSTSYSNGVFEGTAFTTVEIPKRVTYLAQYSFKSNKVLSSVTFEDRETIGETGVTKEIDVGYDSFASTTSLKNIVLPEGLTTLKRLFSSNTALQKVTIPFTVTTIDTSAFYGNTGLTTVTFAKAAEGTEELPLVICNQAFYNCSALTSFELPARTTDLGYNSGASYKGSTFYGCKKLTSFTLEKVTDEEGNEKTAEFTTLYNKTFYNCSVLATVELPKSLTAIGNTKGTTSISNSDAVFYGCAKLDNVVIPDTVTSVQNYTFKGCTGLKTVTLGAGMTDLPENFFDGCKALKEIKVSEGSKNFASDSGVLYDNTKETLIYYPAAKTGATYTVASTVKTIKKFAFGRSSTDYALNATTINLPAGLETIEEKAFYYDKKVQTINFANLTSLKTIGGYAFYSCTAMTSVTIPAGVESIGANAFYGCTGMKTLTFKDGEKPLSIGGYAFRGCTNANFKTLTLPARLNEMGTYAFYGCTKLTSLDISKTELTEIPADAFENLSAVTGALVLPETVTKIGNYAFKGATFTSVTFPAGLASIGNYAFQNCKKLTSVAFTPNGSDYALTSIGTSAFAGSILLTKIDLPQSLKSISSNSFNGCTKLANVTFADDLTSIGASAFTGTALTEITIPDTVTEIGASAFKNCTKLQTVNVSEYSERLNSIGANAFDGCTSLAEFTLPVGLETLGANAFANTSTALNVNADSVNFKLTAGILTDADETTILSVNVALTGGTYTVPDTIETIGDSIFQNTHFTKVVLGDSVTSLGANAFKGSDLEEIVLNEKLQEIGNYAFVGTKLSSVTIGKNVTKIGNYAFQNVSTLTELNFVSGGKNGISIGQYAFTGTNVQSVQFPNRLNNPSNTVAAIGNYAFDGVTSLTSVTFEEASALQNFSARIGDYAFRGTSVTSLKFPDNLSSAAVTQQGSGQTSYYQAIGKYAFQNCEKLESVDFGNPNGDQYLIGQNAFENCTSLGKNGETLVLPDIVRFGTTANGSNAFKGCTSLKAVQLSGYGAIVSSTYSGAQSVFENCTALETATINGNAQYISVGTKWFMGCYSLTTVNLPETTLNIWGIGEDAFNGCTALTNLTKLSAKCTTVKGSAFIDCLSLPAIEVDEGNTYITSVDGILYSLKNGEITGLLVYPAAKTATEFVVPEAVTTLSSKLFKGNKYLKKITIEGKVTKIDTYTFADCAALEEVVLPENVTEIANYAFQNCENLTTVIIPANVTTIGSYVFNGCAALANITIPAGVTSIGSQTFTGTALTEFVLAEGNEYFETEDGVLYDTGKAKVVAYPAAKADTAYVAPATVVTVNSYAFASAKYLQTVSFTAATGLTEVSANAFMNATALISADFTGLSYVIKANVFSGCTELTTVKLGAVTEVGSKAFENCVKLQYLDIPEQTTVLGSALTTYSSSVYNTFAGCTGLKAINVNSKNSTFYSVDGVLYQKENDALLYFPAAKECAAGADGLKTFEIPDKTTMLRAYAFRNAVVEKVVFGSGITKMETSVFRDCNYLKKVDMSKATQLSEVSTSIFQNCSALEEVILPAELETVYQYWFSGCTSLRTITLPSGLKTIQKQAFENCTEIEKIYIPESATIANPCFQGWTEEQTIYIAAATQPAAWNVDWQSDCNARIVWGASVEDYEAGI